MVFEIKLTQGKTALVDDEDKDLSNLKWYAIRAGSEPNVRWYAVRMSKTVNGKRTTVRLHREIIERKLNCTLKKGEDADHADYNGLNNTRKNLRLATRQDNCRNRRTQGNIKSSQYKGVYWYKSYEMWRAQIQVKGKTKAIGYFKDEVLAAKAYDTVARELFGEFLYLNFPDEPSTINTNKE